MLREGGHHTRDARAFRIVHRNHISEFGTPTLVTISPAGGPQGARDAGLGLEVTERVPSGDLEPQPRKQTTWRDQERRLLAILSGAELGEAKQSEAKRS